MTVHKSKFSFVGRAVGDMVEDFDSTRRKSFALLRVGGSGSSGGSGEGTRMVEFDLSASSNSDLPMMKRASRSFSRDLNKLKHLGRKNGASVQDATLQPPPFQACPMTPLTSFQYRNVLAGTP